MQLQDSRCRSESTIRLLALACSPKWQNDSAGDRYTTNALCSAHCKCLHALAYMHVHILMLTPFTQIYAFMHNCRKLPWFVSPPRMMYIHVVTCYKMVYIIPYPFPPMFSSLLLYKRYLYIHDWQQAEMFSESI